LLVDIVKNNDNDDNNDESKKLIFDCSHSHKYHKLILVIRACQLFHL